MANDWPAKTGRSLTSAIVEYLWEIKRSYLYQFKIHTVAISLLWLVEPMVFRSSALLLSRLNNIRNSKHCMVHQASGSSMSCCWLPHLAMNVNRMANTAVRTVIKRVRDCWIVDVKCWKRKKWHKGTQKEFVKTSRDLVDAEKLSFGAWLT